MFQLRSYIYKELVKMVNDHLSIRHNMFIKFNAESIFVDSIFLWQQTV